MLTVDTHTVQFDIASLVWKALKLDVFFYSFNAENIYIFIYLVLFASIIYDVIMAT